MGCLDIVFLNAVIEHIEWENQERFVKEIQCVGKRYYGYAEPLVPVRDTEQTFFPAPASSSEGLDHHSTCAEVQNRDVASEPQKDAKTFP